MRQIALNIFGVEGNLYPELVGKDPAKTACSCSQAKQVQFRRMQPARQGLDVAGKDRGLLGGRADGISDFCYRSLSARSQTFQAHDQQEESLADVVMNLSGNPGAFFL